MPPTGPPQKSGEDGPLAIGWRDFLLGQAKALPARKRLPSTPAFRFELGRRRRRTSAKHRPSQRALTTSRDARSAAQAHQISQDFDAVVVGSGYGGSVAALRLAQQGHRVLLLERGGEYLPGDFANAWSMLPKYLRVNVPGQALPLGRASGLVEMTVGQGMAAITGNGLGGGSLINAGVVIQPDDDVFAQDAWPASIRYAMGAAAGESDLSAAFNTARAELGAAPYAAPSAGKLPKSLALERLARSLGEHASGVTLTIDPNRCIQCGNCAAGCNVPGAKKDLRATYLNKALATGRVQIVTQAEVYRFSDALQDSSPSSSSSPKKRWKLWVFSTGTQHDKGSRQEAGHASDAANDPTSTLRVLSTDVLVISAGTLGSTQLLQRSQALAGDGLGFSPALGTRLSGNGDSISVLMEPQIAVDAVAQGVVKNLPPGANGKQIGPTITAMLDLRQAATPCESLSGAPPQKPLAERLLLQDAAIPGAMSRFFEELIATVQTLAQTERWGFQRPDPLAGAQQAGDPLAASAEMASRAQVLLAMGHDGSPGRMVWMPSTDGSAMVMPSPDKLETYQAQKKLFDRMGKLGLHLHNPLWQPLPESAATTMSGASTAPTLTTVHPLGGCPMGDDPATSVVNHMGQVWMQDAGHPGRQRPAPKQGQDHGAPTHAPAVYPGLYVLDGSVIPTSLGCNPLLTITAIAERAMALALVKAPLTANHGHMPGPNLRNAPRTLVAVNHLPVAQDAQLSEILRAPPGTFQGSWAKLGQREIALFATLSTQDLEKTLKQHNHPFKISTAELTVGLRGPNDRVTREADYKLVGDGATFYFLQATSASSGHGALWQALGSIALLPVLLFGAHAFSQLAGLGWLGAATTDLFLCLLWCLLPFPRTFLTWFILRGWMDLKQDAFKGQGLAKKIRAGFRQLVHSLEKRHMAYHLPMQRTHAADTDAFPEAVVLSATKTVVYRASVGELVRWIGRQLRRRLLKSATEIPPLRPSVWEQLMDAHAEIKDKRWRGHGRRTLFKGRLSMGFETLFSHQTAQMGERGDTTTGLLLLSGYALLALRFAIKTRLYDFRLPSYSKLPLADQASAQDLALRWAPNPAQPTDFHEVQPDVHTVQVPRGHSSSDTDEENGDMLHLRLWRYSRKCGEGSTPPALVETTAWNDPAVCVRKVKSVLLLHAFGQSGLTYTFKAKGSLSGSNLAEAFYNQGYEVWVLDSRMSSRGGHAEQAMNVDMLGQHDVPATVDHILHTLAKELPSKDTPPAPLQIEVFAQCIGAASLWMAALEGRLNHEHLGISKLSKAMFSQVHALTQGTPLTRAKVWLPSVLQKFLNHVPFAVRGPQDSGLCQALDRILSSLPTPEAERKLAQNEDGAATCRRIRFIESPLFFHHNMDANTLHNMPLLFGAASLRLFAQARRFVERGRLVDEDGMDRYVTDHNLDKNLLFPIGLLHGQDNELFAVSGAHATRDWLMRHPRFAQVPPQVLAIPSYGHLDVLLGKTAWKDVFQSVVAFFNEEAQASADPAPAVVAPHSPLAMPKGCRLEAPRVGPLLGWVQKTETHWVVRWSIMLHGNRPSDMQRVLVRQRTPDGAFQSMAAEVQFHSMATPVGERPPGPHSPTLSPTHLRFATVQAMLPIQANAEHPAAPPALVFQTIVLNAQAPFTSELPPSPWPPTPTDAPTDAQIDLELAQLDADATAHNHTARLSNLPDKKLIGEHILCAVPLATCVALADGAATSVEFLASCCRHPGLNVDRNRIDAQLPSATGQAAFALLVGDQIYADATAGLIDPISPIERYVERHESAFTTPPMRRFLANMPTLMTPDDHEWINEFPMGSPLFKSAWADWREGSAFSARENRWREWAKAAVFHFQKLQWPAPSHGGRWVGAGPIGPVRLFVMDSRQDRQRASSNLVDEATLNDLETWMANGSKDLLNIVVSGSVALPGLYPDTDPSNPGPTDTWQHAPAQRQRLLDMLVRDSATRQHRFMLLSGDYHLSAVFSVHAGSEKVGAAVVVPPLYAPLPYVNAKPEFLWLDEPLRANGQALTLATVPSGHAMSGNGLARIQVARTGAGFSVEVHRDLNQLETGLQPRMHATLTL